MNDQKMQTQPTSARNEPISEHDWTIHSLNIHGIFFERWCHIVRTTPPWELTTTDYPVQLGEQHQSRLDIRADANREQSKLILLIECKKNNPDFVNWVFFPKYGPPGQTWATPVSLSQIRTVDNRVNGYLEDFTLPFVTADEARETRGHYLGYSKQKFDKTRTANNAITEAANQIAIATEAIYFEERGLAYSRAMKPPYHINTTILPVIVTSASLFTCEFSPTDVNPGTGEVPYEHVKLSSASYVVYDYPLPRWFFGEFDDASMINHATLDVFLRRHIIVVQAEKLSHFLKNHALNLA